MTPRLDPDRERVARLNRDGDHRGFLLVSVEQVWDRLGGRWWWTSWSPWREFVIAEVVFTDDYPPDDNFWVDQDLDAELARWRHGDFRYLTGPFTMEWLNAEESLKVAQEVFDVDGWVRGQMDWCAEEGRGDDPTEPPLIVWFGDDLRKSRSARPDLRCRRSCATIKRANQGPTSAPRRTVP